MSSKEVITAALLEKISGIQRRDLQPQIAYRAQTRLVRGLRCAANVREFPTFFVDEPHDLGGEDTSANSMELLLVALGTCQEIIFSAYAAVMGIPLDAVSVNVKGLLDIRGMLAMDESIVSGYQHVAYETMIESSADCEAIRKLVGVVENQLSHSRHAEAPHRGGWKRVSQRRVSRYRFEECGLRPMSFANYW